MSETERFQGKIKRLKRKMEMKVQFRRELVIITCNFICNILISKLLLCDGHINRVVRVSEFVVGVWPG